MPDKKDELPKNAGTDGRDERTAPWTIDELGNFIRDGFKYQNGLLADLDKRLDDIEEWKDEINSAVFTTPPTASSPGVPKYAVAAQVTRRKSRSLSDIASDSTETAGKLAELEGRFIAHESNVKERFNIIDTKVDTSLDINKQQSRAQGLAMPNSSFWTIASHFLFSREGAKFMLAAITAIFTGFAALYAARAQTDAQRAADKPAIVVSPNGHSPANPLNPDTLTPGRPGP